MLPLLAYMHMLSMAILLVRTWRLLVVVKVRMSLVAYMHQVESWDFYEPTSSFYEV